MSTNAENVSIWWRHHGKYGIQTIDRLYIDRRWDVYVKQISRQSLPDNPYSIGYKILIWTFICHEIMEPNRK